MSPLSAQIEAVQVYVIRDDFMERRFETREAAEAELRRRFRGSRLGGALKRLDPPLLLDLGCSTDHLSEEEMDAAIEYLHSAADLLKLTPLSAPKARRA
ncbi:MAG: hypothetical protein AAF205_00040 [Pseudomonadota bacterium]